MNDMGHKTVVRLGLGEAIRRFMDIEFRYRMTNGRLSPEVASERELLLQALDAIPLSMGFDCNTDGLPDNVEIFHQAAATSCCRVIPADTSRRPSATPTKPKKGLFKSRNEK